MKIPSIFKRMLTGNSIKIISENLSNQQQSNIAGPDDERLTAMPRYQEVKIPFRNKNLKVPDPVSCYYAFKEIFGGEIYAFSSKTASPRIIDCGANVGLSVMYFKTLFPESEITAVEADPFIFSYLSHNLQEFCIKGVHLIPKAVSHRDQDVIFHSEGADGGRVDIPLQVEGRKSFAVKSISLDELINGKEVDFLKIDIEGAETDAVLGSTSLHLVRNFFVEYHSFSNTTQSLHCLLEKLSASGFRYYIKTEFTPKNPFKKIDSYLGMDLQLNISCIHTSG